VLELLGRGAGPNVVNYFGLTPLHEAVLVRGVHGLG
jgi:hypothetical protein